MTSVTAAALCCVVLAGISVRKRKRLALMAATIFCVATTWFGQQGSVPYLGVDKTSPASWQFPMITLATIAALSIVTPTPNQHRQPKNLSLLALSAAAAVGSLLMLSRFSRFGIPLIDGAQARFLTVASIGTKEAILSSVLIVVPTGMIFRRWNHAPLAVRALAIANSVLVTGTASRLLILAVLVCSIPEPTRLFGRTKIFTLKRIGVCIVAAATIGFIYNSRAESDKSGGAQTLQQRVLQDKQLPEAKILGTGTYISARNGAAVSTILHESNASPPHGFVIGSLLTVVHRQTDPELFLTQTVFGLDRNDVGSTALPLLDAAPLDFGLPGSLALSLLILIAFDMAGRFFDNSSANWIAFGLAMSSYGMYLTSIQFLAILGGLLFATRAPRSQMRTPRSRIDA